MIIEHAKLSLSSFRTYEKSREVSENLEAWDNRGAPRAAGMGLHVGALIKVDTVSISEEAKACRTCNAGETTEDDDISRMDSRLFLIKSIVERMMGRKIRVLDVADFREGVAEAEECGEELSKATQGAGRGRASNEGWGVRYDRTDTQVEHEETVFKAKGQIETADGRKIKFSLSLIMERTFMSSDSVSLRAGDAAKDPLVISFDGTAAELTDTTFSFDLDANGEAEDIPFVGTGSGFLVLDKNGDGVVNDGSELFGPGTGDGFAELSAYDGDGNGWIDERDAAYDRLMVWTKDAQGIDTLTSLTEKGIGAISTERIETAFDITDDDNSLLGQIRQSGVYIRENGTAGIVQRLDIVT